jgi:Tfp pilus assembly protein PilX
VIRRLAAHVTRSEDGFAMLTVLGLLVLLMVLAFSLINAMQGEASRTRSALKRDAAYQAAEAGVDEYISKLIDDRLYYVHFVHPGEATRRGSSSGRLVAAGATWQQTDGNAWTYPRGKDTGTARRSSATATSTTCRSSPRARASRSSAFSPPAGR